MDFIEVFYTRSKKFMKKMFKKVPKQEASKQEPPKQEPKPRPLKIYAYKVVVNCDEESGKKSTRKNEHDRKPGTHKPEPYVKPPFNGLVCRDTSLQCPIHYNKPLFKPSSVSNTPFVLPPPMPGPPYYHQQRPQMHSLPPSAQMYHDYGMRSYDYPPWESYNNRW